MIEKINTISFENLLEIAKKIENLKIINNNIEGILQNNQTIIVGQNDVLGKTIRESFIILKEGNTIIDQVYINNLFHKKEYNLILEFYTHLKNQIDSSS